MENTLNLQWKWNNKFIPVNQLDTKQLKHVVNQLNYGNSFYYGVERIIWRQTVNALIKADQIINGDKMSKVLRGLPRIS